ncbi:MAG TPA: VOC family protein [Sphingomicrobium sp.]|nr:VOC family protein [Sphingomicrobium sp.]
MSRPPFVLEGLDHVVLLVRDMTEAQHFYEQVLGCTVDRALPQYGMLQLRAGASLIDLVDIGSSEGEWARPEAEGGRNMDHVCIATGPCSEQAMRAHLIHHGVGVVEEGIRYGAGGDGMSFYVCDPSGNQIELKSLIAG